MSHEAAEHMAMRAGLPFRPLIQLPDGSDWLWWCPALDDRTGRCTIYADRPQLCRDYAAGSDPLCVHFVARDDDDLVKAA
jgi:Fe-S-cluster containining protein